MWNENLASVCFDSSKLAIYKYSPIADETSPGQSLFLHNHRKHPCTHSFSQKSLVRCTFFGILSIIIHLISVLHSNLQVNDYLENTCMQKTAFCQIISLFS